MASIKKYRGTRKIKYNGKIYKNSTPLYECMLRGGVPVAEIARRLNVTYPAVLLYKKDQEKKGRSYPRVINQYNEALMRAALAVTLAKDKWSRQKIAEAFKMTYAAVAYMLKMACVDVPDLRKVDNRKLRLVTA